ncbi:ComEA family DNA-binding protein [Corynebacterium diphtheriae]|uniref:ComEA family DNA-binding protein n=1 Tax=Corynebacterium diphtheriae TaxID=1717 RepID=UPI0013CB0693|nr:ComEA family DNA-binding protein [Corynebacterium diphtheriae]CAB0516853.1 ComEA family DNA-binding protein [Corynebacterium diphtheriae]CAB0517726.1 ComEA family DNA-binding protein [Corynebacterium diphtheriae]CAB0659484.1 ComEA family DNA-binding protein [Corynebacterium diphtheriae]CAB0822616.1 ComEA family DNA-binding protein [Corynebacterium diphtheriae]CAB0868972.1 ComEA family DNA-binding protein [Corynebacterium diphtheriae]
MKRVLQRLGQLAAPTGTEDLMVVDYPRQRRLELSRTHSVIGAGVIVAVIAIIFLLQPAPPAPAPVPVAAAETSTPEVVVSVVGEVHTPGLYTFAPGARVADALQAAGPVDPAHIRGLNQAEKLVDSSQIVVGGPSEPVPATDGRVRLNSATVAELEQLDGIGAKTAAAIVSYRDSHGGFGSLEELQKVKGIGPAKYQAIAQDLVL